MLFCVLCAALGAMTYITRHPELWLERAHEAELRAACERMEKALEKSVIEHQTWKHRRGENVFVTVSLKRNGKLRKETETPLDKFKFIISDGKYRYYKWNNNDAEDSWGWAFDDEMPHAAPIPYFKGWYSTPFSYEISEELLNVGGYPCIVMRLYEDEGEHHDVWYLDPSIGYMPRKMINNCHDEVGNDKAHGPTITYRDYREIADGIYFPFRYGDGDSDGELGDITVLNVDLNPEFDESTFAFDSSITSDKYDYFYFWNAKGLYQRISNIQNLFQ